MSRTFGIAVASGQSKKMCAHDADRSVWSLWALKLEINMNGLNLNVLEEVFVTVETFEFDKNPFFKELVGCEDLSSDFSSVPEAYSCL